MILHYFINKENQDKELVNFLYKELIFNTNKITKKYFSNKNMEFNLVFEVFCILLIIIFIGSKKKSDIDSLKIKEDLLFLFIRDLDHSFGLLGVSDNNMGKYVKKHTKKFYYRIKKLEIVLISRGYEEFSDYLKKFELIKKDEKLSDIGILYGDLRKLRKRVKILKNRNLLFVNLFK